jgi:hypothetical protein
MNITRINVHPVPDERGYISAKPSAYVARVWRGGKLLRETPPASAETLRRVTLPLLRSLYSESRSLRCAR